jgi:hypothetical protein
MNFSQKSKFPPKIQTLITYFFMILISIMGLTKRCYRTQLLCRFQQMDANLVSTITTRIFDNNHNMIANIVINVIMDGVHP